MLSSKGRGGCKINRTMFTVRDAPIAPFQNINVADTDIQNTNVPDTDLQHVNVADTDTHNVAGTDV